MVKKAKEMGYKYIAITDHSATMAIVKGLDTKKLHKQIEEINELNAKESNFTILKGIEVDILEDGSLAEEETLLKELDIVIAAIHSKFSLSKKEQTNRLIKAIENKYVNIIAHPTGRLIGKRNPIALEMSDIYHAAINNNVSLEINSQPQRLDLNDILIKEAKSYGIKFSIATDAHSSIQLEYMKYGINQARRGWLEKEDVINTLSLEALKKVIGISD